MKTRKKPVTLIAMLAVISVMVIAMGSMTGCGTAGIAKSMTVGKIADEAEAIAEEDEAIVEEAVVEEDEVAVEEEMVAAEEAEQSAPKTEPQASQQSAQTSQSAQSTQPTQQASQPAQASQPVHTHSWKDHYVTTQTWVPNIVVVDDYENQTVKWGEFICDCGFTTTDSAVIEEHITTNVNAGVVGHGGFTGKTHTETQQVKVGSHEEDHGYYETSTYVDYQYCDCGATR